MNGNSEFDPTYEIVVRPKRRIGFKKFIRGTLDEIYQALDIPRPVMNKKGKQLMNKKGKQHA
jgi:hypothetical protein